MSLESSSFFVLCLQAGQERLYNVLKVQLQGMVEELIEQTRR
jgi:hypothetical protein